MATQIPGIASATGNQSVTDHGDYWEVDVHSKSVIRVANGGTLENVLFNTNGNLMQLNATVRNWNVRNVGISGPMPDIEDAAASGFAISGSGTADTLYLGDGGHGNWRSKHGGPRSFQPTGIFSTKQNTGGSITIRNANISNWTDNGAYCEHQGGTIDMTFENCYGTGNDISFLRPGPGTHKIINCHGKGNHGGGRDVWNRPQRPANHVTIRDCQLESGYSIAGGRTVERTQTGSAANPRVPDGCPTSALEAATGDASGRKTRPSCVRDVV